MSVASAPPAVPANRRLVAGVALVVVGALLARQVASVLASDALPIPIDYAAFWTAGWLTIQGENPYDPVRLHEVQRAIGLDHSHAILVYHPPWTLTLLMPLAALPVRTGYGLLCLIELGLVLASADYLWRAYGGRVDRRWVGWLIGLTFAPTVFLLGAGQISGFSLAGLALFLYAARSDRPGLAGVAAALVAVKPHLNFLFGLALLLETTRSRFARRAVLAGLAAGLAASAVPLLFNPDVWALHRETVTAPGSDQHQGLADWKHPLVGSWLRNATPGRPVWVQVAPCLAASALFVGYWWRQREWDWQEALPGITLASLLTAVYGAWSFDTVLLLVPVLAAAARLPAQAAAVGAAWLVGVNVVMYAALVGRWPQDSYVWVTPAVLAGVVLTGAASRRLRAGGLA
jgi:hypothetical protein